MRFLESECLFFLTGIYFLFTAIMVYLDIAQVSSELIAVSFGILGLLFILQKFKLTKAKKR